eukprot:638912-Pleurochrysis_carterae.AAC.2
MLCSMQHTSKQAKHSSTLEKATLVLPASVVAFHGILLAIDVQESEILVGVQRAVAEGGEQLVPLRLRLVIRVAVEGLGR